MEAITTLLCYAHEDKPMVNRLKKHLSRLKRAGSISLWDYGDITAGSEWEQEIYKHLNEARMILLMISPDFMDSDFCYRSQMEKAIEKHEQQKACVIPVILRPVDWKGSPLDKLHPLPDPAKPIAKWELRDEGYENVVIGIKRVIGQLETHSLPRPVAERKVMIEMIEKLEQLIEAVKTQLQPAPRAEHTAGTLRQLSIYTPVGVTLADLIIGWQILSRPAQAEEEPAITQRRATCGELAKLASPLTTEQGNLKQAIKTWEAWRDVFQKRVGLEGERADPRTSAMARTFARELAELQKVAQ